MNRRYCLTLIKFEIRRTVPGLIRSILMMVVGVAAIMLLSGKSAEQVSSFVLFVVSAAVLLSFPFNCLARSDDRKL